MSVNLGVAVVDSAMPTSVRRTSMALETTTPPLSSNKSKSHDCDSEERTVRLLEESRHTHSWIDITFYIVIHLIM